ncbi:MAG: hypothetical protein JSU90_00525 [Nitrospiraceae bacterium]|nr:MAG: hypothetical protein JSU90_00525 [Nitrospiraceae bacterium]
MTDYVKKHRITVTLSTAAAVILLLALFACTRNNSVKEYFQSHGMEYPADVSGIGMLNLMYVGISEDDLQGQGAGDFVAEGIMSVKVHFKRKNVQSVMPGVEAIVVSTPVLYRAVTGEVGLMVKVNGYGTDDPQEGSGFSAQWQGKDRRFWKVENFAYFGRSGYDQWQFAGWVY